MKINYSNRTKLGLRKVLNNAAHFYADKLEISKAIQNRLQLNIFVRKGPNRGSCAVDCYPVRLPTEFDIEIHPTEDLNDMLSSFAHEFVHVKQFAIGELRMLKKCNKWKDNIWVNKKNEIDDYYDSPWEIEAFGREEGLYLRFINDNTDMIEEWKNG